MHGPVGLNVRIEGFAAQKTTPPVRRADTGLLVHSNWNHETLTAWTHHRFLPVTCRHGQSFDRLNRITNARFPSREQPIYLAFAHSPTVACSLPSCGLIITRTPASREARWKNVAYSSS